MRFLNVQWLTLNSRRERWVSLVLLLVFFAQVAFSARHTSITLDEPLHITSGYACLVTGDYRLVEEHPPLLKMLQAFPLLFAQPPLPDPSRVPGWREGNLIQSAQHVVVPYRPIEPLVFAARVPTMLVGILLAALILRWATDAFGGGAGLFALILYVFDPNMLAHAGVAATDLGAACAIFATMYMFWRWFRSLSLSNHPASWEARLLLVAAVTLGLALGVKSTVLITLPIFALFIVWGRPPGCPLKPYLLQALIVGGIAGFVLWSIYRFEIGPVPGVPFPVPAASHFLPLIRLRQHMREGHAAFLMGKNYHHGVWSYFPIAFALKTPLLTLGLLGVTAVSLIVSVWRHRAAGVFLPCSSSPRARQGWRGEWAILALPVLYFGISLTSGLNIGYRHLLPILPFLFVWVSRMGPHMVRCFRFRTLETSVDGRRDFVQRGGRRRCWGQFIGGLAIVGYMGVTLALFPWYLAYFNILAGGPDGGYRYLVDSNLDWGQTWKALRVYLEEHGIVEFGLSQYTINDPHAYGLDYTPLPPWPAAPPVLPQRFAPPPGIYAISSTQLQGVVVADSEMFDYFRNLSPIAKIGHAMFVYNVPDRPSTDWIAQCTTPVAPLSEEAIFEGLGSRVLRLAYFDCSQSWLIPEGNGWYGISREAEVLKTRTLVGDLVQQGEVGDRVQQTRTLVGDLVQQGEVGDRVQQTRTLVGDLVQQGEVGDRVQQGGFAQRWEDVVLKRARLAYEQKQRGVLPPFAIYEWFEQSLPHGPSDLNDAVYAAPSAWPPLQAVSEGEKLTMPIYVGDALLFSGYVVDGLSVKAGQSITLQTRWRIQRSPQEAFSLMAHLLDVSGTPLAVGDGLGVSVDQLEPGDTLIQRHVFAIPSEATPGEYWIQVGAYTYPGLQRLPIMPSDGHLDRLIVGQIAVTAP